MARVIMLLLVAALAAHPSDGADSPLYKAEMLLKSGLLREAKVELIAIATSGSLPDEQKATALLWLGDTWQQEGDSQRALEVWRDLQSRYPEAAAAAEASKRIDTATVVEPAPDLPPNPNAAKSEIAIKSYGSEPRSQFEFGGVQGPENESMITLAKTYLLDGACPRVLPGEGKDLTRLESRTETHMGAIRHLTVGGVEAEVRIETATIGYGPDGSATPFPASKDEVGTLRIDARGVVTNKAGLESVSHDLGFVLPAAEVGAGARWEVLKGMETSEGTTVEAKTTFFVEELDENSMTLFYRSEVPETVLKKGNSQGFASGWGEGRCTILRSQLLPRKCEGSLALELGELKGMKNKKKGETGCMWSVSSSVAQSPASKH